MKTFKSIIKKYAEILFPCLAVGVIIIAWQITAMIYDAEIIMPSPLLTMKEFFSAFTEKEFYISDYQFISLIGYKDNVYMIDTYNRFYKVQDSIEKIGYINSDTSIASVEDNIYI